MTCTESYARRSLRTAASAAIALVLAACSVPLQRQSLEKIGEIRVVQVTTRALEAPTFMQAAVSRGVLGGALPTAVAQSNATVTLTPPLIPDAGALVTRKLKRELATLAWWPRMTDNASPVPANYVHASSEWLRVEVFEYYIAPSPANTLHLGVRVSLRPAGDRGDPLWVKLKIYSGLVHGGEKLDADQLSADPAQINREIERATEWVAKQIVADMRR